MRRNAVSVSKRSLGRLAKSLDSQFGIVFALAVIAMLQGWAFSHGDTTLTNGPDDRARLIAAEYILAAIASLFLLGNAEVSSLVLVPIVSWLVRSALTYGGFEMKSLLGLWVLLVFCMLRPTLQRRVFVLYRYWIGIMAIVGIVCYVAFQANLPLDYRFVNYYAGSGGNRLYADYGVSYLYGNVRIGTWRLCGLFNEPGYFGTIIALTLCADHMDFRKPLNVVMLVAGVLTFSAAFFVLLLLGLALINARNIRQGTTLVMSLAAVLAIFFILSYTVPEFRLILTRFGLIDGDVILDNRVQPVVVQYALEILGNNHLLFGYGDGFVNTISSNNSGIVVEFVEYGLFGTLLIYAPLLAISISRCKSNRGALVLVTLFFISLYQRPGVFMLPFFVLLFGGIENLRADGSNESVLLE